MYFTKFFHSFLNDLNDFVDNTYRELGIGIVPFSPLGRGFFGGKAIKESIPADSFLVWSQLYFLVYNKS